jgi:hypothetical protein
VSRLSPIGKLTSGLFVSVPHQEDSDRTTNVHPIDSWIHVNLGSVLALDHRLDSTVDVGLRSPDPHSRRVFLESIHDAERRF